MGDDAINYVAGWLFRIRELWEVAGWERADRHTERRWEKQRVFPSFLGGLLEADLLRSVFQSYLRREGAAGQSGAGTTLDPPYLRQCHQASWRIMQERVELKQGDLTLIPCQILRTRPHLKPISRKWRGLNLDVISTKCKIFISINKTLIWYLLNVVFYRSIIWMLFRINLVSNIKP